MTTKTQAARSCFSRDCPHPAPFERSTRQRWKRACCLTSCLAPVENLQVHGPRKPACQNGHVRPAVLGSSEDAELWPVIPVNLILKRKSSLVSQLFFHSEPELRTRTPLWSGHLTFTGRMISVSKMPVKGRNQCFYPNLTKYPLWRNRLKETIQWAFRCDHKLNSWVQNLKNYFTLQGGSTSDKAPRRQGGAHLKTTGNEEINPHSRPQSEPIGGYQHWMASQEFSSEATLNFNLLKWEW